MQLRGVPIWAIVKQTVKEFREDDLPGLAAQVAYHLLFSVVPLLIFVTALSATISQAVGIDDAVNDILDWLFERLPPATVNAVAEPLRDVLSTEAGSFLSLGAVLALVSARNAMGSLMKALNVAFDVKETRPWWKQQLIAVGLTVALGLGIIASSAFFLLGAQIGAALTGPLGLGGAWGTVWNLARWPLIFVLLASALAFLYWAGPNVAAGFKWLSPGSVLAVVLWGLVTLGLNTYFRYFGGYAAAYGVLGGVLAFVFWLYVMSMVILFGGELNAVVARRYDPATQADVASHPADASDAPATATKDAAPAEEHGAQTDGAPPAPARRNRPVPSWPSAEGLAREAMAAEGSAGQARRFRNAVAALGASALAAISAAVGATRRR